MKPYYEAPGVKLYLGDSRQLPVEDESIDMIATSPPYWGKRDYGEDVVAIWGGEDGCGHRWGTSIGKPISGGASLKSTLATNPATAEKTIALREAIEENESAYCSLCGAWRGQLGLEPTWQEYIAHLCECAEEWWRVLKPTGNLFVNIGDTFAGSPAGNIKPSGFQQAGKLEKGKDSTGTIKMPPRKISVQKMKLGIPFRLRFALNDMGWVSRDDIIWYKGKEYPDGKITKVAMPESVKDRMSCSYEMLFHFVKNPKGYWFDLDAVRRPHLPVSIRRASQPWHGDPDGYYSRLQTDGELGTCHPAGANPGDVWIIQPEPFKEKHYACWPSALCEMMIKVGCPKEVCPKCGKPRERQTKQTYHPTRPGRNVGTGKSGTDEDPAKALHTSHISRYRESIAYHTIGWSDCGCGEGFVPGVALDPFFGGSYRIAKEALKLGRNIIGVDMKEEYLEMAKDISIYGEKGLSKEKARRKQGATQGVLL